MNLWLITYRHRYCTYLYYSFLLSPLLPCTSCCSLRFFLLVLFPLPQISCRPLRLGITTLALSHCWNLFVLRLVLLLSPLVFRCRCCLFLSFDNEMSTINFSLHTLQNRRMFCRLRVCLLLLLFGILLLRLRQVQYLLPQTKTSRTSLSVACAACCA